ncbi:MAG: anthranilate phosphoribosyltransferase [Verrucomicrobia bacterium]|nr:anthranilate phosphoribosyltransferase [Verrucomicrobiota bacterium]MBI3871246.1 anthranilate phosphoribosyltransferase [Verrucomicrobiota bacterium]
MLRMLSNQLGERQSLTTTQVRDAVGQLTDEGVPAHIKAVFLTRLAEKGETIEEIAAFASEILKVSVRPELPSSLRDQDILDVCGTGGDRLNTFNISTTVALAVSAAGVPVAKHGNRAITSASGSADVLEALGIRIDLPPAEAVRWLGEHRFAFFFAPQYHPGFRHIAPARKLCAEKGQRTLFNFLGPLLNPARPTAQLLGVSRPHLCEPLARVLQSLGARRAMVVCGEAQDAWLDELSTLGKNTIAEFYQAKGFAISLLSPSDLPLQPARLDDLIGGDKFANAAIIRKLLEGADRGPRRDAVLLNAGAALFIAGKAKSLGEGWDQIAQVIDSGRAIQHLRALIAASAL